MRTLGDCFVIVKSKYFYIIYGGVFVKALKSKSDISFLYTLCILLALCIFFSQCDKCVREEPGLNSGFSSLELSSVMFAVKSNTNIFNINSVRFDLFYGLYDSEYPTSDKMGSYKMNPDDDIFFGLYICDREYVDNAGNYVEIIDYKNIDNYYFIKDISEEEALKETSV